MLAEHPVLVLVADADLHLFAGRALPLGMGAKLLLETNEHPGRLKDMVTTPGGTAITGLHTLEHGGVRTTQMNAVEAAPRETTERVLQWQAIDRHKVHEVNRDEVNRILDKINAKGIGSLTPQERIFLSNFVPADDRTPPLS